VLSLGLLEAAEKRALSQEPCDIGDDAEIRALIELRAAAKKAKNFAEADRIRDDLKSRGIVLIDTPQGTTYTKS
jgi:cysteinyl-tRNA synthetase